MLIKSSNKFFKLSIPSRNWSWWVPLNKKMLFKIKENAKNHKYQMRRRKRKCGRKNNYNDETLNISVFIQYI